MLVSSFKICLHFKTVIGFHYFRYDKVCVRISEVNVQVCIYDVILMYFYPSIAVDVLHKFSLEIVTVHFEMHYGTVYIRN